ncbi:MAG: glycosyltransferase family 4 protein [Burkholderiales bacterium]
MKICLVGATNLAVLAPEEYGHHTIGGEAVQQTLLARALARRGHDVSMAGEDYGQPDGAEWDSIRVFKTYPPRAGVPVLRFIHPRWTGTWSALSRADAELYYVSEAGMHVGLVAAFCRRLRRRFVFRTASDADCDPSRLMVRFARDRWLYAFGLRRADAILVQSSAQAKSLWRNYGLASRVAGMLVEQPLPVATRDIDVLWVGTLRSVKRPDRVLELAGKLPKARIHMVGGAVAGEKGLFREIQRAAATRANLFFHGHLSYQDTNRLYGRARLLLNTSDVEGFPNSYLQAWVRGVPVVTLIDPDRVIEREELGIAAAGPAQIADAVHRLLDDPRAWRAASDRCRGFMAREYGEDRILAAYLEAFGEVMRRPDAALYRTAGA